MSKKTKSPKSAVAKAEIAEMEMASLMDSDYDETGDVCHEPEFSEPHPSLTPPYYPPPDAVPPKDNHYITPEGYIMEGPEYRSLRFDDDDFS